MSRKKQPTAPLAVPATYEEANAVLLEHGRVMRELTLASEQLAQQVVDITAAIELVGQPLKARLKVLEAQLEAYADQHRSELTDQGKVKFHDMPAGRIGWRKDPPSVGFKSGFNTEKVIAELKNLRLGRFLRRAWAINKEAMLEDQEKAVTVPGVKINKGAEKFYFEPVGAKLSDGDPS